MSPENRKQILCSVLYVSLSTLLILEGTRRSTAAEQSAKPSRIDAPFNLAVETPHISWGKPSPAGPVRAYAVPSVSEGRTLVELAERIDMKADTVMIDDAWDVNTWTVGTDDNYEARNYKLLYRYLEEDLTAATPYDVIILPSLFGWNRLPQAVRDSIRKRVEQGTGLVLIHPVTGLPAPDDPQVTGPLNDFAPSREIAPGEELWDMSPLVGVLSDRIDARGFREIRPDAVAVGPWKVAVNHYISANVPFESFPTDFLKHYKYRLGKDSDALVTGPNGEPIVATKMFGKGRVVALGYVNTGFSPMIDWNMATTRAVPDDHWWEYFYSLLGRSILWAAHREPSLAFGPLAREPHSGTLGASAQLSASIENRAEPIVARLTVAESDVWGKKEQTLERAVKLRAGQNLFELPLAPVASAGRHYMDVILEADGKRYDWGSLVFDLPKANEIASLSTDKQFYSRGDTIRVKWATRSERPANVSAELKDNRDRLLAVASVKPASRPAQANVQLEPGAATNELTLKVGNYSTNIGWVRLTLLDGEDRTILDRKQVRVNFASLDRDFGAYELIMPWYGPPTYQPWTATLDEQFRKMGVTVLEAPERNFKLVKQVRTPGFGIYWHYRQNYLQQKDKFLETGDKKYLVREPDLADDHWLGQLQETMRADMQAEKQYRPLAYYLADESSLTAYGDPFDYSWSGPTLTNFRAWQKTQYANLDALNQEWETHFDNWDEVIPLTTAEAQAKGNYAGWMDHRTFMEQVFAHALEVARDTVKQEDASGRASISGTQVPGPSNAVNWYLLDNIVDYLQPYSDGDQDELHRGFLQRPGRPDLILTGFTGYERHGKELRHELWHRLLHGQTGASLFWHYTALNADLTLTEQGRDLSQTADEFRNEGLALLLRGADRENCGIAVHYSLLSGRGQWITDGRIQPHEVSDGDRTSAHLKRFHQNRSGWLEALHDAGYQFDLMTTEQVEAGKLAGYGVLILPDSIALSDGEVAAIRKFVSEGGFLIADAETGLMDGHARWQEKGRLDEVLDVARRSVRSAPGSVPSTTLQAGGGESAVSVLPSEPELQDKDGQPLLSGNQARMIHHTFGRGHSALLNFWMTDYGQLRESGAQGPRLALLHDLLDRAGVRPVANVHTAPGKPLACSEVVAYTSQSTRYLAILPEPACNKDAGPIEIKLPQAQYAYDLRAHHYLGNVSQVSGALIAGEPVIYALRSLPIGRLSVGIAGAGRAPAQLRAGDTITLSVRVTNQDSNTTSSIGGHSPQTDQVPEDAVYVEVRNPSGKILDYYGATVLVAGEAQVHIPTALNDEPGRWSVTVREPFTHAIATASFRLIR